MRIADLVEDDERAMRQAAELRSVSERKKCGLSARASTGQTSTPWVQNAHQATCIRIFFPSGSRSPLVTRSC